MGRSRLRELFRREDDRGTAKGASSEPATNTLGEPIVVTVKGEFAGYRARDGSVIPVPERRRIREEPDTEWHWVGGEWRERWADD